MGKHSEWRKLAKKARRKRIRSQIAEIRKSEKEKESIQRENTPSYKRWLQEQEKIEEFQAKEEERLAREAQEAYLEREKVAQKEFVELQKKLALAREERAKQNAKIKEEWDREQRKLRELKEEKERKEELVKKQQELLQERIEEFINSKGDMPEELTQSLETNPGKVICPFFKKTAACRFNDSCSRNHIRPTVSRILLIKSFYTHYSLQQTVENEYGSDSTLEFESKEVYMHFRDFFNDILPEMEKFGEVRQLKVCCNQEPHLRGNVYVEYAHFREAMRGFRALQGRWYGGRQLGVEFCSIDSWRSAICGLFFRQRCPKGSVCNFLHVFRNPSNLFQSADRDLHRTPTHSTNDFEGEPNSERSWRWSESPERYPREDSHSKNGWSERSERRSSSRRSKDNNDSSSSRSFRNGSSREERISRSKRRRRSKSRDRSRSGSRHSSTSHSKRSRKRSSEREACS